MRKQLVISSSQQLLLLPASPEDAIEQTWKYCVNEDHLPSGRREAAQDFVILLISSGAILYGIIADKYAKAVPTWARASYDGATVLSAAVILINATNEFLLRRDKRYTPKSLRPFNLPTGKWQKILDDLAVVAVSAIASVSLSTAAWRYSSNWAIGYRIPWVLGIELVNTGLHLLPVELVAFNHPVFSLPIKPFIWFYNTIRACSLSLEEKEKEKFMAFKRQRSEELSKRLIDNLDQSMKELIDDHFEWNNFSKGIKKWFSYVKKPTATLKEFSEIEIKDIIKSSQTAAPISTRSTPLLAFLYLVGAVWVILSNLGFLADPPATLQEGGMDKSLAWGLSIPAIYFLGVLLAHMGGDSFQSDVLKIHRAAQGRESMPLQAKLHTKSFGIALLINLYASPFASAAAEQMAIDHFDGTAWELPLIWAARTGVAYFSFAVINKFYSDYLTKWVRFNSSDENHLIALLKDRVEFFKRHIPSDPDILVASFKKYNPSDLPLLIGMTKEEFLKFTNFEIEYLKLQGHYREHSPPSYDSKGDSISMSPPRPKQPSSPWYSGLCYQQNKAREKLEPDNYSLQADKKFSHA